MSIKARFDKFARAIRPTDEHIKEANRQTDYMVEQLKSKVAADRTFTLEKVLKAGSNAKFTSLRRTQENIFDVDLGAYFSGEGAVKTQLSRLLEFTHSQLREIYRATKPDASDFEILKSAVRVKFKSGIKLNVDVTPIVADTNLKLENAGWIPRDDGEWRLTSVTCHNEFVRRRTGKSDGIAGPVRFNRLVRLVKWWNNLQDDLAQPSIFCELVAAASVEECGNTSEWQTSLRNVFNHIRKNQFLVPVVFGDYYDPRRISLPDAAVVILDAVNPDNNVTRNWTETTRRCYIDRAQEVYDRMMEARSHEIDEDEEAAADAWCEVFSDAFRTLSEPDGEE